MCDRRKPGHAVCNDDNMSTHSMRSQWMLAADDSEEVKAGAEPAVVAPARAASATSLLFVESMCVPAGRRSCCL